MPCQAGICGFHRINEVSLPMITLLFTASLPELLPATGDEFRYYSAGYHHGNVVSLRPIWLRRCGLCRPCRAGAADALGLDYRKPRPSWRRSVESFDPRHREHVYRFKDTTLVVFIGILIRLPGAIRTDSLNGIRWNFTPSRFASFIFCFGMSKYSQYLEGKLKTDHH
jgi:hypothetical protein